MLRRILEGSTRISEVILSHHVEPSQYCCGGIIMMRGSPCLMCAAFATRRLTLRSLKKSNGTKKALYKYIASLLSFLYENVNIPGGGTSFTKKRTQKRQKK